MKEPLAERGIDVDQVTLHRWVQRFTPLLIKSAQSCRHCMGRCWSVDETYVEGSGTWWKFKSPWAWTTAPTTLAGDPVDDTSADPDSPLTD